MSVRLTCAMNPRIRDGLMSWRVGIDRPPRIAFQYSNASLSTECSNAHEISYVIASEVGFPTACAALPGIRLRPIRRVEPMLIEGHLSPDFCGLRATGRG